MRDFRLASLRADYPDKLLGPSGILREVNASFDPGCRRCARLAGFLGVVKKEHPGYHCAPVAPFGDPEAKLLIVGLAPGKHGANASGRPFTGDHAGILLYRTLYQFGFSSGPESHSSDDGLSLRDCRITNAVKCLPPGNKPLGSEVINCNRFLKHEIEQSRTDLVILALGTVAHRAVLRALDLRQSRFKFSHDTRHVLPDGRILVDSFHCSRYNTQTGRLTEAMFIKVFKRIRKLLE